MVNTAEMRMGLGDVSPRHPGVAPTVLSMLQSARRGLAEAADESAPGARYVTAHLAALRAGAGKRAAAEAGLPRAASAREADDLLRDAETFLSLAETALGVEVQSPLPLRPAG